MSEESLDTVEVVKPEHTVQDEDDATLEELRTQERLRARRIYGQQPELWRQMRNYLFTMKRKKVTYSPFKEEKEKEYVHLGLKTEIDEVFMEAVRENNVGGMRAAIIAGANPRALLLDGSSALHVATEANAMDTLLALIHVDKLSLSMKTCRGSTPLHISVKQNNTKITYTLVMEGANLNIPDVFGKIPLHFAIERGNVKVVRLLLYYGSNPNAMDCFGVSPLYAIFTASTYPEIARALLNAGADVNMIGNVGIPLLSHAVLYCNSPKKVDAIRMLVESDCDLDAREAVTGHTALHFAAMSNNVPVTKVLLEAGANPNLTNDLGMTPLETALMHRSFEVQDELQYTENESSFLNIETPEDFARFKSIARYQNLLRESRDDRSGKDLRRRSLDTSLIFLLLADQRFHRR